MAEKLSAKQAAIEIGTDARTLRKFLRSNSSPFDAVGQGNRYEFTSGDLKKLKKKFVAWSTGSAKKVEKVIEEDPTIEEEVIDEEPEEAFAEADPDEEPPFEELDIEDEDEIEVEDEELPPDHHASLDDEDPEDNYCPDCDRHFKNARGLTVHNNQKHTN